MCVSTRVQQRNIFYNFKLHHHAAVVVMVHVYIVSILTEHVYDVIMVSLIRKP